jgi:hypothetical protein
MRCGGVLVRGFCCGVVDGWMDGWMVVIGERFRLEW